MKSCSILVTNYNGFESLELTIESILYYTRYPNYKIIVHDDYSSYIDNRDGKKVRNIREINYLRECQKKGWIELIESHERRTHGGSLNVLVNEVCDTDYAMLLDNDIQIKGHNWLRDLIDVAEADPKIIAVVDWRDGGFARRCYRTAIYLFWFGLLKMNAYRDGMEVDWKLCKTDRRDWPYYKEFEDGYPPENSKWAYYYNSVAFINKDEFDANLVSNDPGAKLYIKVKYYNPKGYKVVPLPAHVKAMYHHFGHISMISIPDKNHEPHIAKQREERFGMIRAELARLKKIKT